DYYCLILNSNSWVF
nr:immunoglobulin light chain junction region [Macaca mulatta]